jgi:hypothetical protein
MFFVFAKTSEKEKLGNFMTTDEESPNFYIFSQPNKGKGFAERARASIHLQQSSSFGFMFSHNMFVGFLLQNFVATINVSTSSFFLSPFIFLQNQAK